MPLVLVLAFVAMMSLCFGVIHLLLRPSKAAQETERRLHKLLAVTDSAHPGKRGVVPLSSSGSLAEVFENILRKLGLLVRLELLLMRAQSRWKPGTICSICVLFASLSAFVLLCVLHVPILAGCALAFASGTIPLWGLQWIASRRLAAFNAVLADCIDMCARALRAGHSLTGALGMVAEDAPEPAKTEFAEIFRKQSYGLSLREALLDTLLRMPSADMRVVVTGMLVQKETGGNLVDLMDRLSALIRERSRIQREVRTHTAQGRVTGWILCLLPIILLGLINMMSPGYSKPLLEQETGRKLLYLGLILLSAGAFTIHRIVRGVEI